MTKSNVYPQRNFNPRSPHGERPCRGYKARHEQTISIHAPRTGSDGLRPCAVRPVRNFNPRSPHGERQRATGVTMQPEISIHAPRTGSDAAASRRREKYIRISIHAPRTGSDRRETAVRLSRTHFNPRSPHGERQALLACATPKCGFQSTLPARGATDFLAKVVEVYGKFQSTLPARGATAARGLDDPGAVYFNPRSPHGERRTRRTRRTTNYTFQSTLPARGATAVVSQYSSSHFYFNPRSPHGERPSP